MSKKEKKQRTTCMYPRCNKDVYDNGKKFCGEHQRKIDSNKNIVGKVVAGAATVVTVAKVAKDKLPEIIKNLK